MKKGLILIVIGLFILSSCGTSHLLENNLKNANESGQMKTTGQQLVAGVDPQAFSHSLVQGLSDALSDSVFQRKLQNFIGSIITQTGSTSAQQIDSIKLILVAALDQITEQLMKSESNLVGDSL